MNNLSAPKVKGVGAAIEAPPRCDSFTCRPTVQI
jgi:hypothetical protein